VCEQFVDDLGSRGVSCERSSKPLLGGYSYTILILLMSDGSTATRRIAVVSS